MSETSNIDYGVEIPDAEPQDFGSQQVRRSLSPALKFGIVIIGVFAIITASIFVGGSEISNPTSSISVNAELDSTPGGENQSNNPRYQKLLELSNQQEAANAIDAGINYIPTPENILQPIEDLEAGERVEDSVKDVEDEDSVVDVAAPPLAPVTVAPPPSPTKNRKAPVLLANNETQIGEENPYTSSMIRQMGAIGRSTSRPSLSIQTTNFYQRAEVNTDREDIGNQNTGNQNTTAAAVASQAQSFTEDGAAPEVMISAGDIIYGETLTSTNSDLLGAPILVELTSGEYRGSKLVGSFTVDNSSKSMVVQFSTLTTVEGNTYDITAFAIDGKTAEGAVVSHVERRYLQRYGPILASAFIASYSNALSDTVETITNIGEEVVVLSAAQTAKQARVAGLGAAAQAISGSLRANAPSGPKVVLREGWPIAVIFTVSLVAGT